MARPGITSGDEDLKPATASEVRGMVGDVDDAVIAGILATNATAAEVQQAVQWFRGAGGLEGEPGHEPHGAMRAVYDILQAAEPPEE